MRKVHVKVTYLVVIELRISTCELLSFVLGCPSINLILEQQLVYLKTFLKPSKHISNRDSLLVSAIRATFLL